MTPNYVAAVKTDTALAEQIVRLRAQADNYHFSPEYGVGASVGDDGITFYDVEPAQYDDGWDVNSETASWDDIANAAVLIPELERRVAAKKEADARAQRAHKREQLERLKRELGED